MELGRPLTLSMLEMMNAATAPIGRGLARSVLEAVERDMLDVDPPENGHTVYWVTPAEGGAQHATLTTPPETGGPVDTLGGHGPVEAPPNSGDRMRHTQRFCPECFAAYLNLPGPTPRWKPTE